MLCSQQKFYVENCSLCPGVQVLDWANQKANCFDEHKNGVDAQVDAICECLRPYFPSDSSDEPCMHAFKILGPMWMSPILILQGGFLLYNIAYACWILRNKACDTKKDGCGCNDAVIGVCCIFAMETCRIVALVVDPFNFVEAIPNRIVSMMFDASIALLKVVMLFVILPYAEVIAMDPDSLSSSDSYAVNANAQNGSPRASAREGNTHSHEENASTSQDNNEEHELIVLARRQKALERQSKRRKKWKCAKTATIAFTSVAAVVTLAREWVIIVAGKDHQTLLYILFNVVDAIFFFIFIMMLCIFIRMLQVQVKKITPERSDKDASRLKRKTRVMARYLYPATACALFILLFFIAYSICLADMAPLSWIASWVLIHLWVSIIALLLLFAAEGRLITSFLGCLRIKEEDNSSRQQSQFTCKTHVRTKSSFRRDDYEAEIQMGQLGVSTDATSRVLV